MALVVGPLAVVIGVVAVFFVMRRKSVEKRSMYSARRSQIEHKVRAARQRTLAPHGHAQKPQEQTIPGAEPSFAQQAPQATVTWATPTYEPAPVQPPSAPTYAPTAAPPSAPPPPPPTPEQEAPAATPWDVPAAAAPTFDYPPVPSQPAYEAPAYEPFQPAPEPTPMAPSEPAWTPAPAPAMEPAAQLDTAAVSASSTAAGAWSIVSPEGQAAPEAAPDGKKKKNDKAAAASATGDWSLASGNAPDAEADEPEVRRSGRMISAVALYFLFVVGLLTVLIGVLVTVANAHVT